LNIWDNWKIHKRGERGALEEDEDDILYMGAMLAMRVEWKDTHTVNPALPSGLRACVVIHSFQYINTEMI
jgi:hypothetical protein